MATIDLDAARRARAEERDSDEPDRIVFAGRTFDIPDEFTYDAAEAAERSDWRTFIREILGDQVDEFFALKPTVNDLGQLARELMRLRVGGSPGETPPSSASSGNGSKRSRSRSKSATAST